MHIKNFKYHFITLIIILLGVSCSMFAQKERVILVPYTRFQFVSDFSLEEIATHNNVSSTEVFNLYQQGLNSAFSQLENDNIKFVPITQEAYRSIKKYIRYNEAKFDGRKYNASNLSLLPNKEYQNLLQTHNATAILFVNWYSLQKSVHTVYIGDRNKRAKYSSHLIDYDVYNQEKTKVLGKGLIPLVCSDFPSESVINHKSLNVKELDICYTSMLNELAFELSNSLKQ